MRHLQERFGLQETYRGPALFSKSQGKEVLRSLIIAAKSAIIEVLLFFEGWVSAWGKCLVKIQKTDKPLECACPTDCLPQNWWIHAMRCAKKSIHIQRMPTPLPSITEILCIASLSARQGIPVTFLEKPTRTAVEKPELAQEKTNPLTADQFVSNKTSANSAREQKLFYIIDRRKLFIWQTFGTIGQKDHPVSLLKDGSLLIVRYSCRCQGLDIAV